MRARAARRRDAWPPVVTGAELLPGYRALAVLAHGRRLDTYDAWDEARACRVVVKILRADRQTEPALVEALLREGTVLATLGHPHLVRCFEVVADPPAVVLETLTGATLDALVDDGPLLAGDVAQLGLQLTSALGYLHARGWLHLDVKPANVVVDHGRAVLIDLSHADRPGDGSPGAGTVGYLAPEQVTGRDLSPATDVWLLGITLWEALTTRLPHEAGPGLRNRWSRRAGATSSGATSSGELPGSVPPVLADVLAAALAPAPADRPALAELAAACQVLAGDPRAVDPGDGAA